MEDKYCLVIRILCASIIFISIYTNIEAGKLKENINTKEEEIQKLRLENIQLKSVNDEYYDYYVLKVNVPE